jgi:hypothetical protein
MSLLEDSGKKIGKYLILDVFLKGGRTYYVAECEKGHERTVRADSLKANSDVCFKCDRQNDLYKSPSYNSWDAMVQRCSNPNNVSYYKYGAVGIKVFPDWQLPNGEGFKNFYEYMGDRPEGMTIDRFPTKDGNYEPGNVRWATVSEQSYNQKKELRNTSGRTGVGFYKNGWTVHIGKNNVRHYLGRYKTFEEACSVREKAELEFYGYIKE